MRLIVNIILNDAFLQLERDNDEWYLEEIMDDTAFTKEMKNNTWRIEPGKKSIYLLFIM